MYCICQNFRSGNSNRVSRKGRSNERETLKRGPVRREGEKGEPSKPGPSTGDNSDEERPKKKQKTCNKSICGDCPKEMQHCVCWDKIDGGKISY